MAASGPRYTMLPIPFLIFLSLQPVLFWTLSWPRYATALVSLAWLFYRANQVLNVPVEDLVQLLGLEVPTAPTLTLLDLTPDSISLHWKAPDKHSSVSKYIVRVNGLLLSELPPHQTAITIENLPSAAYYSIRVTAVNSSSFQATSEVLRVKTLGLDPSAQALRRSAGETEPSKAARIIPLRGLLDQLSLSAPSPPVAREAPHIQQKRGSTHRRSSPGPALDNQRRRTSGSDAAGETIPELTARLDALRRELQEIERQDVEEEDDYESKKTALLDEKESLRLQLKEKEDGSRKIKGSVTNLERASATAQSRKNAQERILLQRKQERQKVREDMIRWDAEIAEMDVDCKDMRNQIVELQATILAQIDQIRTEQDPDLDTIKLLEQKLRDGRVEVDELEDVKKSLEAVATDGLTVLHAENGVDDDLEWSKRYNSLKEKLSRASMETQQALIQLQQTQFRAQMLERRSSHAPFYQAPTLQNEPPASNPDMPLPIGTSRSPSTVQDPPVYSTAFSQVGSSFARFPSSKQPLQPPRTSSPFFHSSGLVPPSTARTVDSMSSAEAESLTGGPLNSPGASGLLPSDLLGDEPDEDPLQHQYHTPPPRRLNIDHGTIADRVRPAESGPSRSLGFLPGLGALPGGSEVFDGNAAPAQRGPVSPISIESGSHSLFSSPHGSNANLHHPLGPDALLDSDQRSLHSLSEGRPSKLLGSLFGRQRGKTTSIEGPALGSLKPAESQSLPRSSSDADGVFPPPSRKGPSVFGQMSNTLLGRRGPAQSRFGNGSELSISGPMNARPSAFGWNDAGSNPNLTNPWTVSARNDAFQNSRPASVYSENQLPRPDQESGPSYAHFGWSTGDVLGRSSSTRTGGPAPNNNPWSTYASRRASVAASGEAGASASQLSGDSLEDGEDWSDDEVRSPPQAPIGTRPHRLKDSQLNPAAGVFTMFKKDRDSAKGKRKERSRNKGSVDETPTPQARRSSRDGLTPSIDGSVDVEDGFSVRTGESIPSTPNEATTPGPASSKSESFMRKLSRKGSSAGKFNLSLPGRDKSSSGSFFRRGGTPSIAATDESNNATDEDASAPGQSRESIISSPHYPGSVSGAFESPAREGKEGKRSSGFSLSGFKKRGKKVDAPSISEASMTTDEEHEVRASVEEGNH